MRRLMGYEDPEDPSKNVDPIEWSKLTPGEVAQFAKVFGDEIRLLLHKPTSLNRSVLSIATRDYEAAVGGLIDIFMRHLPEERRAAAAEEADAFLKEGTT
jgi:hypothetical protein